MNPARFSIERPVTTLMFFIAIILLGVVSLSRLSIDLLPSISYPRLSVITQYPGVAPEEVETLVTVPLEASVSRIPGLRRVESVSKEGFSFISLEFTWGSDMNFALLHTRERLDSVRDSLPEGCEKPVIISLDPQSSPIMTLAMTGQRSLLELKELAEDMIKPRLEQVEGIAAVEITGGVEREIQVELEPEKLANYGLSLEAVSQKIAGFNRSLHGGTIRKGKFLYSLRITGEFNTVRDIEEIPVKFAADGGVVLLKHIGRVVDSMKEREGTTRLNGRDSIGLLIRKEYGTNTVRVSQAAREVIEQIKKENPEINLEVITEQAGYIQSAIASTREEIIQGAILAFLTLLLFLQEWKSPLIIGTVIPISIIGVFNILFLRDMTLNLMSLGGLALGVGMLDDTAVVVSENIFRHRQLGAGVKEAASTGTREVNSPVAASVLTTIVVFLPVIYVRGLAEQLFKDTALTVTYTLLSALLVSVTLLPMLASREKLLSWPEKIGLKFRWLSFGQIRAAGGIRSFWAYPWLGFRFLAYNLVFLILALIQTILKSIGWLFLRAFRLISNLLKPALEALFRAFNRRYQKFVNRHSTALEWSLNHKKTTFYLALVLFSLIAVLAAILPRELMPPLRTSSFNLNLKMPAEYSLDQTEEIVARLEGWLQQQPECRQVFSQVGIISSSESFRPDVSVNSAVVTVEVGNPQALDNLMSRARKFLAAIPDLSFSASREQTALGEFLALTSGQIVLKVKGQNLETLRRIALDFADRLKSVPGLTDVNLNLQQGKPQLLIKINPAALEKYPDLTAGELANFLVQAIRGQLATKYREMEKKYDVRIWLEPESRKTVDRVLNSFYPHGQSLIPLQELVSYELVEGLNEIRRENQEREILVTANLRGRKFSRVVPAIQTLVRQMNLPAEYRILFGGEREEMVISFRSLLLAFLMAVVLIYMIMAAQFESLLHPFLIMFTIPMGLIGTAALLLLTGQSLNVISLIGVVVLVGIVVNNAIVEIDYINQLRREGHNLRRAVVEGTATRLRPIMMSTLSTIAGLIPMALGLGRGAELLRPLAIAVIGGLTSSLFLTLILIPVLYEWVENRLRPRTGQN
ncbi:MAG: efflux RND transporter permease subunit [Candidatus Saccharicenans sp.]|uniref:efflux RND transporter permease subunit n=1 Tax=Candidatus Saccharicenans sp. TaxID=2819258 RepID=UPI004048F862